jgi:hypothetical protein
VLDLDGDLDDAGQVRFGSVRRDRTGTLVLALGALDEGDLDGTSCSSGPWFLARFVSVRFTANLDGDVDEGDLDGTSCSSGPRRRERGRSCSSGRSCWPLVPGQVRFGSVRRDLDEANLDGDLDDGDARAGPWHPSTTGTSTTQSSGTSTPLDEGTLVQLGNLDDTKLGDRTGDARAARGRVEPPRPGPWFLDRFVSVRFTPNLDGDVSNVDGTSTTGTLVLALGALDGDVDAKLGTEPGTLVLALDGTVVPGQVRFGSVRFGTSTKVLAPWRSRRDLDADVDGNLDARAARGPRRRSWPLALSTKGTSTTQSSGTSTGTLVQLGDVSNHQGRDGRSWTGSFRFGSRTSTKVLALGAPRREPRRDARDVSNHQGRDGAHELGSFRFGSTGTSTGTHELGSFRFGSTGTSTGTHELGSFRFGSTGTSTGTSCSSGTGTEPGTLVLALDARGPNRGRSCWPSTLGDRTGDRRSWPGSFRFGSTGTRRRSWPLGALDDGDDRRGAESIIRAMIHARSVRCSDLVWIVDGCMFPRYAWIFIVGPSRDLGSRGQGSPVGSLPIPWFFR